MKVTESNTQKEIDWSKKLQIFKGDGGSIVISTGKHSEYNFEGFCLTDMEFTDDWAKVGFKIYQGSITLEND
jgi:Ser-tRNA(Ala) deacylase AlaX